MNQQRFMKLTLGLIIVLAVFAQQLLAQNVLVELSDISPEETKVAGFSLSSEQEIEIIAVGAHKKNRHWMVSNAWILDADNRDVVWELTDANSKWRDRKIREYKDSVTLPRGNYEVYYANYPTFHNDDGWSFSRFFFRDRDKDYYDEVFEEFMISVTGNGSSISTNDILDGQASLKEKAIVNLTTERDDQYLKQGFKLSRDMDVIVYCVGEARDGSFDYGWIINSETRKHVWKFDYRDTDYAGGGEKNRMIKETISLPAGTYAAFYVTDDSHSPREWNVSPPFDPSFWGLSIFAENENDKRYATLYDYEDIPSKNVVLEFTRLRDEEYVSKGFTLKKDMKLRIYALGEGVQGDMYDYGWIVDAKTHKRVWEMDYRDTEHAGGNNKNRLYDDIVDFKKGNYIAHYVTDGSHSYRRWNASPPFDQEKWGLTILGVEDNFNSRDVAEFDEEDDESVIAKIVRVRDWETKKEKFNIRKDSEVRIYAIGEGSDGQMYDYAWIEDENTGKVVWEMTYRKTDHAGGAKKNREFNDTVFLRAGDYMLFFESDDSHSFGDWNSTAPRDPSNWGVTIYAID